MVFDQKNAFFTQISERSTCSHLHHSDLNSGDLRYLEMTKNSLRTPKPRVGGILYYKPNRQQEDALGQVV